MPISEPKSKSLQRIVNLLNNGKTGEALTAVRELTTREETIDNERSTGLILESHILIQIGEYEKALKSAREALSLSQGVDNPLLEIDAYLQMAEIYYLTGTKSKADNTIKRGMDILRGLVDERGEESPKLLQRRAWLLYWMGRESVMQGVRSHLLVDPERCLTPLEHSNTIFKEINDQLGSGNVQFMLFNYYGLITKEYDKAEVYAKQGYDIFKESDYIHEIGWSLVYLGALYHLKDDPARAWEYLEESKNLLEKIGNKLGLASSHLYLYLHYIKQKKINKAKWHLQRIITLSEEIGNKDYLAMSLIYLGLIYRDKGYFDLALGHFQRSLSIYEELNLKHIVANLLHIIGYTYFYKDKTVLALDYFEQSKRLFEEIGDEECIIWAIWSIINVIDEATLNKRVQPYLETLKQIAYRKADTTYQQFYQAAKGIVLEKSPRIRDKTQAQELFRKILENKTTVDSRIVWTIIVHLIDILVGEAKAYGAEDAIREAKSLLKEFYSPEWAISTSLKDIVSEIEVLILQSKFALLDGKLSVGEKFLDQARVLADSKGLEVLLTKVAAEKKYLTDQMDYWQKLVKDNAPFQTKLEVTRIIEYLEKARKIAGIETTRSFTDKKLPYSK